MMQVSFFVHCTIVFSRSLSYCMCAEKIPILADTCWVKPIADPSGEYNEQDNVGSKLLVQFPSCEEHITKYVAFTEQSMASTRV